jgi:hypothetical protein
MKPVVIQSPQPKKNEPIDSKASSVSTASTTLATNTENNTNDEGQPTHTDEKKPSSTNTQINSNKLEKEPEELY